MENRKLSTPKYHVRPPKKLNRMIPSNDKEAFIDGRGVRKKNVIVVGKKSEKEKLRVEVDTTTNPVGYMIMAINDAVEEYGVSYEEALTLMYLFEVGGFSLYIYTNNKRRNIGDYLRMGYIELAFKEENIYQLSDLGKEIVFFIYDRIKDPRKYLKYLNKSQKESDNAVAQALGKYFS